MLLNLTVSGVCLKALTHAAAALISAALKGSSGCWATLETILASNFAQGCTSGFSAYGRYATTIGAYNAQTAPVLN
jgi:hypothetical protein